jgi:hypothetical protein
MGTSSQPTGKHNGGKGALLDDEYMMMTYKVSFKTSRLQLPVLGGADAVAEIENLDCKCAAAQSGCSFLNMFDQIDQTVWRG